MGASVPEQGLFRVLAHSSRARAIELIVAGANGWLLRQIGIQIEADALAVARAPA